MSSPLTITADDTNESESDRFHRFKLIGWWDQERLRNARVLVIGAGALGNEIVKNLALLGIGNILIADMDRIENSNLSRSVLYRAADNGQYKATVAARSAREIYPDVSVQAFNGNVVYDLGLGVYRWADVVIGGLDNREARLAINRACYKVNRPWVDGAIETIQGTARVFVPPGACYECTMSATDWKLLQNRRSCNLLTRQEMQTGKTPTTPTISSIIAGIQCQEAVKILHGLPTIAGKGFVMDGMSTDSYIVEYQRKEDCYSHDAPDEIVSLDAQAETLTVRELMHLAREKLGTDVTLELGRDVLHKLLCPKCKREEERYSSLGKTKAQEAICPHCPDVRRDVVTFHTIRGDEPFIDRPLAQIGIPPFDILVARSGVRSIGFELSGDAEGVLGAIASADRIGADMSEPNDPSRDVRQIDSSDVASRAFPESLTRPAPTTIDKGFAVVIKQSVLNDIHKHGQSVERIEVCGVLVGNLYRDPTGPYLSIDACIRGDHASSASTNVTFTADTWTHIQESLELDHPGKRIVGWYHTHPSFGIFLSEMDVFICDNFFPLPWQVAYVFDPVQLQDGCFAWHEGQAGALADDGREGCRAGGGGDVGCG